MGIGILAPVPATIIKSAIETCDREGVVAFGTNAMDVFLKAEEQYGADIPVIILPTVTYGDPQGYGRSSFLGKFLRFVRSNKQGFHPDSAKRPAATLNPADADMPVLGFWEVADLKVMEDRVQLKTLTAEGKKSPLPGTFKLHGPLIVTAGFL